MFWVGLILCLTEEINNFFVRERTKRKQQQQQKTKKNKNKNKTNEPRLQSFFLKYNININYISIVN